MKFTTIYGTIKKSLSQRRIRDAAEFFRGRS
jgi:hypothetical protein